MGIWIKKIVLAIKNLAFEFTTVSIYLMKAFPYNVNRENITKLKK